MVEFDPDSSWYETSLSITSQALRQGVRVEYHTFMHLPREIRDGLSKLGLDKAQLTRERRFRIWDSYTPLTGLSLPQEPEVGHTWEVNKASFLADLTNDVSRVVREGVVEEEKRWLHIEDNTSVINGYLSEQDIINVWQTRIIPYVKVRELISLHSFVAGVASDGFYRKFESLCDGIFDLRTEERDGRVKNYIRTRAVRSMNVDSRWRQLNVIEGGNVALANPEVGTIGENDQATREVTPVFTVSPMMQYLVQAFEEDYARKRLSRDRSGWRSLMDIVSSLKIPKSQAYGEAKYGHTFGKPLETLVRAGMVEYRAFSGKGRGGNVLRVRACYEKEPVRKLVDRTADTPVGTPGAEDSRIEQGCAMCSKPVGAQPFTFEVSGEMLHFDSRDCLITYRKLKGVHGDVFR